MNPKHSNIFYLLAIFITVVALLSYPLIPQRKIQLLPNSVFPIISETDKNLPGNSQAYWLNKEQSSWYCHMKTGAKIPECRFGQLYNSDIKLWYKGINLSRYQKLQVDINYQGPATSIRLYFRNFDPEISQKDDFNSAQFITTTIRQVDYNTQLEYELNELHLPDWWVNQYNVPRKQAKLKFSQVTEFGIDFNENRPFGEHTFQINNISLTGTYIQKEHWYLGILSLWLTAIAFRIAYQLNKLFKHSKIEQFRLAEMTHYANELKQKSETYKNLSITDALTQTLNRYGLQHQLQILGDNSATFNVGLILLDIDHFKHVNDKWGHNVGDEVLCS
ncbi:GGDEF domain-containing protein, partial [Paraglaciecola sp.]|uniref:GGDEF domain-containing protein n=1 Tax=Paraglaciecola sp. TaxID=1920173 RepID=UPI003EF56251